MKPVRIFIVDDTIGFIYSAQHYLKTLPEVEVIGYALSTKTALESLPELRPDLVLLDLVMPGVSGLEALQRIKAQDGAPRVIVISIYDDPEYVRAALEARADAFITKNDFGKQLMPTIRDMFSDVAAQNRAEL